MLREDGCKGRTLVCSLACISVLGTLADLLYCTVTLAVPHSSLSSEMKLSGSGDVHDCFWAVPATMGR